MDAVYKADFCKIGDRPCTINDLIKLESYFKKQYPNPNMLESQWQRILMNLIIVFQYPRFPQ